MKVVKELQALHRKREALVKELLLVKETERKRAKHGKVFFLRDGLLLNDSGVPVRFVDSDGEIKRYLKRRNIKQSQIVDFDNRRKAIFNHKSRGNVNSRSI